MRLGIAVTSFDFPGGTPAIGPTVAAISRAADEARLDSLWAMDHFFQISNNGSEDDPMLEVYSVLPYMAALTEHVKLGAMVTGVIYRQPAVLINQVTTLDVLSHGRAYLGIGAAWNESESKALGLRFPPMNERFQELEHTLKLARSMWLEDEPMNHPQPISQPHPPILIGGSGERKTLRFVARYGDATNMNEDADWPHKLDVLRRWCEVEGTDFDRIEKTAGGHIRELDRDDILTRAEAAKAKGIEHWILEPHRRPWDDGALEFIRGLAAEIQSV
jgi:alkanesulfonate monooxygenase SsuD/methylene tetrahydromethanopterin reductase-like flavin-dependent oxidoreductase (luciferase family)